MSERIVREFTIERTVRRESTEFELKASFVIFVATPARIRPRAGHRLPNVDQAEGGYAQLDGEIFLANGGIPWDGNLTKREKERLEEEAYEAWLESNEPTDRYSSRQINECVDAEFDDGFDVGMALKVAGKGMVVW